MIEVRVTRQGKRFFWWIVAYRDGTPFDIECRKYKRDAENLAEQWRKKYQ